MQGWCSWKNLNPYPAKLIYLNFQPLEVVSLYHDPQIHNLTDPQPQVVENYSYLLNLRPKICQSWWYFIPNTGNHGNSDLIGKQIPDLKWQ